MISSWHVGPTNSREILESAAGDPNPINQPKYGPNKLKTGDIGFRKRALKRSTCFCFAILGVGEDGPDSIRRKMLSYVKWLSQETEIPKLHIDAEPGMLAPQIRRIVKDWPNMETKQVKGLHFLQEDSPDEIGIAIREFLLKTAFWYSLCKFCDRIIISYYSRLHNK